MRPCGGCTMCCKLPGVAELEKPAATWCPHCKVGQGCKIYAARPPSCRTFQCLWTRAEHLPEGMRPDRCGVIWMLTKDGKVAIALTERDKVMDRGSNKRLHQRMRDLGISVVITDPRRFPDGAQEIYLAAGSDAAQVAASLRGGLG